MIINDDQWIHDICSMAHVISYGSDFLLTMDVTKEAGIFGGNAGDVHVANWQCV